MAATLQTMLGQGGTIMAPGVGDALGALVARDMGFKAVAISGYAVSASLGYPDVGLVTLSETVERAARICAAVDIPVIADGDNGYGNVLNVNRTVRELERAGVAAIILEDQVFPKRCGGLPGVQLVSAEEMCGKLLSALDARRGGDTLIIARTDAVDAGGFNEAIRRARLYRARGADAIMLHGLRTEAEFRACRAAVEGPLMVTVGSRSDVSAETLRSIGIGIVMYPLTMLRTALVAMRQSLAELQRNGIVDHQADSMMPMPDLHRLVGAETYGDMEIRYGSDSQKVTL